jgi:hypothetical protein
MLFDVVDAALETRVVQVERLMKSHDAVADAKYGMLAGVRGGVQCSRANMEHSLRTHSDLFAITAASLARCCAYAAFWNIRPVVCRVPRLQLHSAAHSSPRAFHPLQQAPVCDRSSTTATTATTDPSGPNRED